MPFPAGSGNDTVARFVQPQLAAALGQQLVIDNRAGAAGNLGAHVRAEVAKWAKVIKASGMKAD